MLKLLPLMATGLRREQMRGRGWCGDDEDKEEVEVVEEIEGEVEGAVAECTHL
jgi:hypothetical protein